ncbi:MAG: SsrA-binding protein SmpB [Bacteroidaceae bacterium]|nr:SsrA-binding protein SmpB [Bacteroidaceae bacterium]
MAKEKQRTINIKNRKAPFDYVLLDKYTAGLVLTGTEIKSIRQGKASLVDTYCVVQGGEMWVKGMNIAQYFYGTYNNHAARRDRKLLLNRREIHKLSNAIKSPGFTIVPTLLFIDENGRAKLDIHLARGKKSFDKRETLKEKEDRRDIDRQFKHSY